MGDYLTDLNSFMEFVAKQQAVVATALAGEPDLVMVVTRDEGHFADADSWAAACGHPIGPAKTRGPMIARKVGLTGGEITILLTAASHLENPKAQTEVSRVIDRGLFEIHDPQGIIKNLSAGKGVTFAENDKIKGYGDISSDFFRLVGLGEAMFISDNSTLLDWCQASGLKLEHANARIREIYGVIVEDLDGGLLIDIFERIRTGEYYKSWRAEQDAPG